MHPLAVELSRSPDPGVLELGEEVLVDLLGQVEDRASLLHDHRVAQVRFVAGALGVDPQDVQQREEPATKPFHAAPFFGGYGGERELLFIELFEDGGVLIRPWQVRFVSHHQPSLDIRAGLGILVRIAEEEDPLPTQELPDGLQL